MPSLKRFWNEIEGGQICQTIWSYKDVGHNQSASKELKELFQEFFSPAFPTPKPTLLIERMLKLVCGKDDIFLDFFAGASSSAIATYAYNLKNQAHVAYIQVQLPEFFDKSSELYRGGFETVSDVSIERIRRASSKIRSDCQGQLGFGDIQRLDLGFKVLKLNQSNFKLWQAPVKDISDEELLQQMELNVDHVDPNASQEDLLYELLIKAGVMPTEKVEQIELAGRKLFSVADGTLLVHLEDDTDQALMDAVLAKAPGQFICLDKAFHGNDQLKTNAVKTFEAFNQGKEKIDQIDFKTV